MLADGGDGLQWGSGYGAAIVGVFSGIVAAGVPAAILLLKAYKRESRMDAKIRRDDTAQEVEHYVAIVDRQEKQIARMDVQMQQLQRLVNRLYRAVSDCRRNEGVMYSHVAVIHSFASSLAEHMRTLGEDVGQVPVLPDRPATVDILEDFEVRTTEQNTLLAQEVNQQIKEQTKKPDST